MPRIRRRTFSPRPGAAEVDFPPRRRASRRWVENGTEVTPYYDPMLAKLIVHGADRTDAVAQLQSALARTAL